MNNNDQNNPFTHDDNLNNPAQPDTPWYQPQAAQPNYGQAEIPRAPEAARPDPDQAVPNPPISNWQNQNTGENTFENYETVPPQDPLPAEDQEAAPSQAEEQPSHAAQESVYSPYFAEHQSTYNQEQNNEHESENKDLKTKGASTNTKILAVILVVIIVICGVAGAYIAHNNSNKSQNSSSVRNDGELVISDGEESSNVVSEIDESDGLSSAEIYAMNLKSNVGIILYASNQSLFSSNNTSKNSNIAGEGSGIVMGSNSDKSVLYIITCAHVISNAKSKNYTIGVQDYEGNQYDAEYIGADVKTDIGVISIKYTDKLPAAKFGDSSKLVIGETVYAIGNPGGTEFFGSFTKGMISSIDRPVSNEIGYEMKSIQHDAAINPGNSGGMLINSSGEVVGINSSKIASTEYEGMGFSIPIKSAKPIIDDLIKYGYVKNRPKLGISYSPVSAFPMYAMIAHYNDLPAGSLIIREIPSKSAFSNTNVKVGDLITAVNGEKLETADVLLDKIENGKVGDKLTITICRIDENKYEIGSTFDVEVTLIEDDGKVEETTQQEQTYDYFSPFGY